MSLGLAMVLFLPLVCDITLCTGRSPFLLFSSGGYAGYEKALCWTLIY